MGGQSVMFWGRRKDRHEKRGFLMLLVRDTRGNALMIMAAAMIPLMGMVGGGIDLSRMYIVKTRLQHACDAGALAGRKAMGGGTWGQSGNLPRTQAVNFFNANIANNAFGATIATPIFAEASGKVTGSASADLPMTLMRVFGKTTETLTVTCDAEMRLPNTDIMFVLDTTGSMAENIPGESTPKMAALKTSVKCFFEIVARLNTNANCEGGDPSGGTGDQVQIRFGFVPYSTNVNVGRLLPTGWMADKWDYQSREASWKIVNDWVQTGQMASSYQASQASAQTDCTTTNANALFYQRSEALSDGGKTKTVTERTATADRWQSGTCYGTVKTTVTTFALRTKIFDRWKYDKVPLELNGWNRDDGTRVPGLKRADGTWEDGLTLPIGNDGTDKYLDWDGCIEERQTTAPTTDFDPIPKDAYDLDIELTPVSGDRKTLWGPALPGAIYQRAARSVQGEPNYNNSPTNTSYWNKAALTSTTDNYITNRPNYFCPTAARKMTTYTDASDFQNYVDSLNPTGNTYHDIGLLWGARLMWPTGIFRAENEFTDKGGEIDRHIIFMTDGETNALPYDYTAYGLPWFDRRQTNPNAVPTATQLNQQVDLRFAALCTAIKNNPKGITLWVINFGTDVGSATKTRLSNCATSPEYFFDASDSDELQKAFRKIADDISQLRLTK